jgi:hypothetical protein
MSVGGQRNVPAALLSGKKPDTHCVGGWVGPRAGLDPEENLAFTGIRSSDRPARSESIPTALSRLTVFNCRGFSDLCTEGQICN